MVKEREFGLKTIDVSRPDMSTSSTSKRLRQSTLDKFLKIINIPYFIIIIIIFNLSLTYLIFEVFNKNEFEKSKLLFIHDADIALSHIYAAIHEDILVIGAIKTYFQIDERMNRQKFSNLARFFLKENPSIQALEWIPRVSHGERHAYEMAARADGITGFSFIERHEHEQGKIIPARQRDEYFPVYFLEPLNGNEAAMGFDLASNVRPKSALDRAADSGQQVATASITLVQGTESQPGILVFDPIYGQNSNPEISELQREKLKGFALAVLRVEDVIKNSTQSFSKKLYISVSDVTSGNPGEQLYTPENTLEPLNTQQRKGLVNVAGRTWEITILPKLHHYKLHISQTAWGILALCITLSIVISIYLFHLLNAKARVLYEVETRTGQLRQSEANLETLVTELRQANTKLGRFAFVASHDLQEPLRKLQQFSDFLTRDCAAKLNEDEQYFLKVIRESSRRMSQLINDLLTYSKTANSDLHLIDQNLMPIAHDVISEFDVLVTETDARISYSSLPTVKADPVATAMLLRNLIGNALKYRDPDRQPEVEISDATELGSDLIKISIRDNGIGFDMADAAKIMEPFKRLQNKHSYPGSGIGLALCQTICDRHHWTLHVRSVVGKGSTFTVEIPKNTTC